MQFGFVEALDLHQAVHRLALEGAIQARPPLLFHLALQGLLDLQFGARHQVLGHALDHDHAQRAVHLVQQRQVRRHRGIRHLVEDVEEEGGVGERLADVHEDANDVDVVVRLEPVDHHAGVEPTRISEDHASDGFGHGDGMPRGGLPFKRDTA